jgi:hypothetical protein
MTAVVAIKHINLLDAFMSAGKSALKVLEAWGLLRGTSS